MKTVILWVVVVLLISFFFLEGAEKQDLWIQAATEKNLETRLQLFENYKNQFGQKIEENSRFLYYNLTQTSFLLQQFEKTIEYGEKTLTFENLEDNYKLDVGLWLANAFNLARKDYDKAYSYADMIITLGKTFKSMPISSDRAAKITIEIDKMYIAPGLRIQLRILDARPGKDTQARLNLIQKAIDAYNFDKSSDFPKRIVITESVELAKANLPQEAIDALEKIIDPNDIGYSEGNLLAQLYYRKYTQDKDEGDKDRAIYYYEKAYEKNKLDTLAAKLGQLLSKKDKEKALIYFADAYVLSGSNNESDAYKYLQQIWFKDIAKDKTLEEQEAGFQQLIEAAKARLGK